MKLKIILTSIIFLLKSFGRKQYGNNSIKFGKILILIYMYTKSKGGVSMQKKAIIIILILITVLNLSACGKKEKKIILSTDVKKEVAIQENETKKLIESGIKFLNEKKYDDAKNSFEKAISMDKSNRGAYIQIKNRYMEKQRIDDAYYIIKLAIGNGVDTENMKELLKNIKSEFEVAKLSETVYQNNNYKLPSKIRAKINNENKDVNVIWNNNVVNTNKLGSVKYKGKIEQYDRDVELNLKVIKAKKIEKAEKIIKTNKIGWVKVPYERNRKRYLKIDEVEFFLEDKFTHSYIKKEALKDGVKLIEPVYYIRNKETTLKEYEISPKAEIYVTSYMLEGNSIDNKKITYEKFKTLDRYKKDKNSIILCKISLENDVIVKIEQVYIP